MCSEGGGVCGEGVGDEYAVKGEGCGMCVLTAEFVYRVHQVMLVTMAKLVPRVPRARWE